jgi:hypothetical protein
MEDSYTTKSIGKGIAETEDCVLKETAMARLIFRPQVHKDGVRGFLIRQRRRSKDDEWNDDERIDVRTLEKGDSFNVLLDTESIARLQDKFKQLYIHVNTNGIDRGTNKYKTVKEESLVIDVNEGNIRDVVQKIISSNYTEEVLKAFEQCDDLDISTFTDAQVIKTRKKAIGSLEQRLNSKGSHHEVKGEDSWQRFILQEYWMFGANYLEPIDRTKINIRGSMPDFIYPTADGFADILDIKLPSDDVIIEDKSHSGAWKWSSDTNAAIGQLTNYIVDIDRLRLEIEREIKEKSGRDIMLLKPRAYILTGDSINWPNTKREGLRKLNYMLQGVEILTYRDLVMRARRMVA